MKDRLYQIFSPNLNIDIQKINESISKDDTPEWDSISHLIIISNIEEEFNISFSPEEIEKITSISLVIDLLNNKI